MTAEAHTKPFILCADDYAHDAAVSDGILALTDQGRLTATSAMVLSPRWAQDAVALRGRRGALDVGLHLDWTSPFATAAGHGMGLGALMLRALSATLPGRARLRQVVARQLDAFERHWQAAPDHIDGHQHVQQFPGLRQALVEEITQRYGSGSGSGSALDTPAGLIRPSPPLQPLRSTRPWLRLSRQTAPERDAKGRLIAAMGAQALARFAQEAHWPHATWLSGVYGFEGSPADYRARMQAWLAGLQPGTVLMCHPARDAAAGTGAAAQNAARADGAHGAPRDGIAPARRTEFAYLSSDAFAQDLAHARAVPVRMAQMRQMQPTTPAAP